MFFVFFVHLCTISGLALVGCMKCLTQPLSYFDFFLSNKDMFVWNWLKLSSFLGEMARHWTSCIAGLHIHDIHEFGSAREFHRATRRTFPRFRGSDAPGDPLEAWRLVLRVAIDFGRLRKNLFAHSKMATSPTPPVERSKRWCHPRIRVLNFRHFFPAWGL